MHLLYTIYSFARTCVSFFFSFVFPFPFVLPASFGFRFSFGFLPLFFFTFFRRFFVTLRSSVAVTIRTAAATALHVIRYLFGCGVRFEYRGDYHAVLRTHGAPITAGHTLTRLTHRLSVKQRLTGFSSPRNHPEGRFLKKMNHPGYAFI